MVKAKDLTKSLEKFNLQSGQDVDPQDLLSAVIGFAENRESELKSNLKNSAKQAVQIAKQPSEKIKHFQQNLLSEQTVAYRGGFHQQWFEKLSPENQKWIKQNSRIQDISYPPIARSKFKSGLNDIPKIAGNKTKDGIKKLKNANDKLKTSGKQAIELTKQKPDKVQTSVSKEPDVVTQLNSIIDSKVPDLPEPEQKVEANKPKTSNKSNKSKNGFVDIKVPDGFDISKNPADAVADAISSLEDVSERNPQIVAPIPENIPISAKPELLEKSVIESKNKTGKSANKNTQKKFQTDLKTVVDNITGQEKKRQILINEKIRDKTFSTDLLDFEKDFLISTKGQINREVLTSILNDSYREFLALQKDSKDENENKLFDAIKSALSGFGTIMTTGLTSVIWPFLKKLLSKPVAMLKNSLKSVTNLVKNTFKKVWEPIEKFLNKIFGWFKNFKQNITKILNKLKTKFGKMFNAVKAKVASIVNNVRNSISKLAKNIGEMTKSIFNRVGERLSKAKQFMSKAWSKVASKFSAIKQTVQNAVTKLKPATKYASTLVDGGKTAIKNGYEKSGKLVKQAVQKSTEITTKTKAGCRQAIDVAKQTKVKSVENFTRAKDKVVDKLSKTANATKSKATHVANQLKTKSIEAGSKAKDAVLNKLNKKPQAKPSVLKSGLNKVKDFATNAFNKTKQFASKTANKASELFKTTKSFGGKVASKAKTLGTQGVEKVAQIASKVKTPGIEKVINGSGKAMKSVSAMTKVGGKVVTKALPWVAAADTAASGISMAKDIYTEGLDKAGEKFTEEANKKKWWENALDLVCDPAKFAFNVEALTKKTLDALGVDKAIVKMKQTVNSVKDPYWVCETCPLAKQAQQNKLQQSAMSETHNQFTFKDDGDIAPFAVQQ